jgi:hypothetical protein
MTYTLENGEDNNDSKDKVDMKGHKAYITPVYRIIHGITFYSFPICSFLSMVG